MKASFQGYYNPKYLAIIFFLLVFLPQSIYSDYFQIIITIALVALRFNHTKSSSKLFGLIFLISITISMFNAGVNFLEVGLNSIVKVVNIFLLLTFYPFSSLVVINKNYILIAIAIILLSQLIYFFNIISIKNIIEIIYSDDYFNSSELLASQGQAMVGGDFRFGGIFRNPNHCGRIITILTAIYLVNKQKIDVNLLSLLTLSFFSIFLTGSRTALIILIILFLFFFIKEKKINFQTIIIFSIFFVIIVNFINPESRILSFNLFDKSPEQSSLGSKFTFLINYFEINIYDNINQLLFGTLNIDEFNYHFQDVRITRFDFEYGYLIHGIGIIGTLLILLRLVFIFILGNKETKYLFILMLWTVSSTILTNFRLSLMFILILSFTNKIDYQNIEKLKKKDYKKC